MSDGVYSADVAMSSENCFADADVSSKVTQTASHQERSSLLSPVTDRHIGVASGVDGTASLNTTAASGGNGVDGTACLNTSSDSQTDKQRSAVHGVVHSNAVDQSGGGNSLSRPQPRPSPGITQPALLPATEPVSLTPVHPHMMPYSWPPTAPPLCAGILPPPVQPVPPGFASAPMPFVGQTLSMPYSSLPVYPAYGYQMMPGSWPFISPSFCSTPPDECPNNTDVDKVD